MKKLLIQNAAYNSWANQLLFSVIDSIPGDKKAQEIKSSFNSIHQTLLHMLNAESIWWQRMKLQERILVPSDTFTGTTEELTKAILDQNKQWHEWTIAAQDHMLVHEFIYFNSKKEKFKQPIYEMLIHIFNHGTYHRGQLVNMLRQLDITKIPATDFIVFTRKKSVI